MRSAPRSRRRRRRCAHRAGACFARSRGRCCARRSRTRSCWASSRASPTSAIRSCWPATSTCCRRRYSSPSRARSTTRAARPCLPSVLLGLTLLAFWLQQRWVGQAVVRHRQRQGRRRRCRRSFRAAVAHVLQHGGRVDRLHAGLLRRDPRSAASCKDIGRGDMTPTLAHFVAGFGIEWAPARRAVLGLGVEQPLHDDRGRRDLGAADGDRRPAGRVRDHAPPVRRPPRVRVPDARELRDSRAR